MDIKPLSNSNHYFSKDVAAKKSGEENNVNPSIKDKLDISAEAKQIQQGDIDLKKIEEIKQKIQDNFYNSDEVINTIADKILKEISPK